MTDQTYRPAALIEKPFLKGAFFVFQVIFELRLDFNLISFRLKVIVIYQVYDHGQLRVTGA